MSAPADGVRNPSSSDLVAGEPVTSSPDSRLGDTRVLGPTPGSPASASDSAILRSVQSPVPPEVASAPPAAVFGKFVRVQKLGKGGMGEVWKAWDTALGRWVAVKFLSGGDETEVARFAQEAHVAGRLSHPNITAVYEVGEAQGRHFIAMQYIDGTTASKLPRGDRRALARIVRDAARGVAEAHRAGVIHRDLKPENLLVRGRAATASAAEGWQVFVTDFGLARRTEGASGLSVSGAVVGTPAFMAPEQARGEKAGAAADVYGLGSTLYDLLTGKAPFKGENVFEVLQAVQEQEPPPLRLANPAIEPDLQTIVLKCLEKDPLRRYATADDVADDLDRWLEGEPIAARPASLATRLGRRFRKRKHLYAIAFLGVLAVGVVLGTLLPAFLRESEARRRQERALGLWVKISGTMAEAERLARAGRLDLQRVKLEEGAAVLRGNAADLPEAHFFLGWILQLQGNLTEAEAEQTRALALDPDFAEARIRRGIVRADRRILEGAAEVREMARERGEDVTGSTAGFGEIEARRPELLALRKSAADDLAAVTAAAGRTSYFSAAQRGFGRALLLYMTQRPDDADTQFGEVLSADPTLIEAIEMRGLIAFERGNFAGAAVHYRAAIRQHQGRPDALLQLAISLLVLARREPFAVNAPEMRAEALAATEKLEALRGPAPGVLAWKGSALADAGRPAEAIAAFDAALTKEPANAVARLNRGIALLDAFRYDEALADFDAYLALHPSSAMARLDRGHALAGKGDHAAAIADYDEAMKLRPRYAEAMFSRALEYVALGKDTEALADYNLALDADPRHANALNNRGNLFLKQGRFRDALADYEKAIAIQPRFPAPWFNRGDIHLRMSLPKEAIADYDQAMKLRAPWPEAQLGRGVARLDNGDPAGAASDFQDVLKALPDSIDATYNLGVAWAQQNKLDLAIDKFTATLKLNIKHLDAWQNRAGAKAARGDWPGAESDYTRALEIQEDPQLFAARAQTRLRLNQRAKAVEDFEEALRVAPADWEGRAGVEKAIKLYGGKKK